MLKVLINSYACCPGMGSEPGMGWNWIVSIARHCEVYVISEGEFREQCEASLNPSRRGTFGITDEMAERIHFYWNPVPQATREKCWNQGNYLFYFLYWRWQKKTAKIAREICKKENIDVLHQLNMIGFREPGNLHSVAKEFNIPLVWGPIGGLKMFPMAYAEGLKMKAFGWFKNTMNVLQMTCYPRVSRMMKRSDVLISSIQDSYVAIKKYYGRESVIIPETGCSLPEAGVSKVSEVSGVSGGSCNQMPQRFKGETLNVMWAGKFDFRKRLDIAIRSVIEANERLKEDNPKLKSSQKCARIPRFEGGVLEGSHQDARNLNENPIQNPKIKLCVYGTGNDKQVAEYKAMAEGCPEIDFMGNIPPTEIPTKMRESDVFLFTSVNEDTSTVVLEAVSSRLPVVCFDACGMAAVVTSLPFGEFEGLKVSEFENECAVGVKVPLTNPKQSVEDFADVLVDLYEHREKLVTMSNNCKQRAEELSWDSKGLKMLEIYSNLVG